jgi:hypothetical protein
MLLEMGFRYHVKRTQVLEEFQAGHPRRPNESKLRSLNERRMIAQFPREAFFRYITAYSRELRRCRDYGGNEGRDGEIFFWLKAGAWRGLSNKASSKGLKFPTRWRRMTQSQTGSDFFQPPA